MAGGSELAPSTIPQTSGRLRDKVAEYFTPSILPQLFSVKRPPPQARARAGLPVSQRAVGCRRRGSGVARWLILLFALAGGALTRRRRGRCARVPVALLCRTTRVRRVTTIRALTGPDPHPSGTASCPTPPPTRPPAPRARDDATAAAARRRGSRPATSRTGCPRAAAPARRPPPASPAAAPAARPTL